MCLNLAILTFSLLNSPFLLLIQWADVLLLLSTATVYACVLIKIVYKFHSSVFTRIFFIVIIYAVKSISVGWIRIFAWRFYKSEQFSVGFQLLFSGKNTIPYINISDASNIKIIYLIKIAYLVILLEHTEFIHRLYCDLSVCHINF